MRAAIRFVSGSVRPLMLLLAGTALNLAAAGSEPALPYAPSSNGWVLADLNGDQNIDLATTRPGRYSRSGYTQEVRVKLGASHQTSFRFHSRAAIIELSAQDVDGDEDGDLIVFEPLSPQPIGVWLNDGAGSFHEGRLADFQKLWSGRTGPAFRSSFQRIGLFAIFEERIQPFALSAANSAPGFAFSGTVWQSDSELRRACNACFSPRGPPFNS